MLEKFHAFLKDVTGKEQNIPQTTLIFDKGNNSIDNFALLDSLDVNFVGSVKLGGHKDLVQVANDSSVFKPAKGNKLKGTKSFQVRKKVYGCERTLVVTYNQNLFNAQWLTLQNDISKSTQNLAILQQKLEDRANGIIKRGKAPTVDSVQRQCSKYLKRQHLKHVINIEITTTSTNVPKLDYKIDNDALHDLSKTYLGKNILITNREDWDDTKIITAYRSQFLIEDVFKEMKDRSTGNWWPMLHWTDSKIKVHGLYCTIAVLIRALMARRVAQTGLRLPMKRILLELDGIREVINIYPRKGRQKVARKQSVLSKLSETQEQLMSVLQLKHGENSVLG